MIFPVILAFGSFWIFPEISGHFRKFPGLRKFPEILHPWLEVVRIPREENETADAISKYVDPDDWRVDPTLSIIWTRPGVTTRLIVLRMQLINTQLLALIVNALPPAHRTSMPFCKSGKESAIGWFPHSFNSSSFLAHSGNEGQRHADYPKMAIANFTVIIDMLHDGYFWEIWYLGKMKSFILVGFIDEILLYTIGFICNLKYSRNF